MENPSESIFINRELSWLDFDSRVLALAKEKSVPLAERIKFAAIFGSNMDEFFMVRVGSLYDQTLLKNNKLDIVTHMTPSEQIAAITPRVAELQAKCDKYYQHLLSALKENKYIKVDFDHLDKQQEHYWKAYFTSEILPILSPQVVDQRHPFPFLRNKEIYYAAQFNSKNDGVYYGIIPLSGQFEQLLFIKNPDGTTSFAFADELIAHYAASIFNKSTLQNACLFRVTRNADITVDEGMMDHDIDFRDVMSELLKKRRKLAACNSGPALRRRSSSSCGTSWWSRRTAAIPKLRRWTPGFCSAWPAAFRQTATPLFPIRQPARFRPLRIMICMPKPTNMTFCSLTRTKASALSSAC